MKKFLALLLALVMVLSFAACNQAPVEPEQPEEPEVPEEPTEPEEPETHARLEHADWADDVKAGINDMLATYGIDSENYKEDTYAVFDFDNTCSIFDVEEQLAIYQLETMTFAFTPDELPAILSEGIGDHEEVRENDYAADSTYTQWINDITKAYTYLYEQYGPFTAKGLDEAAQATIQADPQWVEFSTKMRAMYGLIGDCESVDVSYPWVLYWFTNMTEQEVYDLAFASHSKYKDVESEYVTLTSPEEIESEVGVVSIEVTRGTAVSDNIVELWKALDENGIDVWVCSASATDPIRAAIDVWGMHDYCTGMLAMTNKETEDNVYVLGYDYENGCGWFANEDGTWTRDTLPTKAQTQGVGKTTAIVNAIAPHYNDHGPIACFMDSTGDFNFCTEFETLKTVICFNRANRKPKDGGGIIAAVAMYEKDTLGYDFAKADAAGDTLYLLQGREENGLRSFRNSNATMRLDKTEEILFADGVQDVLDYMIANNMTVKDAIDLFAIKTAADAENNVIGVQYGCLKEYAGYHYHA